MIQRLGRSLAAAWRAFVAEWQSRPVRLEIAPQRSVAPSHPAFGGTPASDTSFLVKRYTPEFPDGTIVYNDENGALARDAFCAEKASGTNATLAMFSGGQWQLRDWCPR